MAEEHAAVVRVIVGFARDVFDHWKTTRDNGPLRAVQRMEIGLGRFGSKIIAGEWPALKHDIDPISRALQLYRLIAGLAVAR